MEVAFRFQKIAQRVQLLPLFVHEVIGRNLVEPELQNALVPAAAQDAKDHRFSHKVAELFIDPVHARQYHLRRNGHILKPPLCFAVTAAAAAFWVALTKVGEDVAAQAVSRFAVARHLPQALKLALTHMLLHVGA